MQEWKLRQNHLTGVLWNVLPPLLQWLWSCKHNPQAVSLCVVIEVVALFKEIQWGYSASPSTPTPHVAATQPSRLVCSTVDHDAEIGTMLFCDRNFAYKTTHRTEPLQLLKFKKMVISIQFMTNLIIKFKSNTCQSLYAQMDQALKRLKMRILASISALLLNCI